MNARDMSAILLVSILISTIGLAQITGTTSSTKITIEGSIITVEIKNHGVLATHNSLLINGKPAKGISQPHIDDWDTGQLESLAIDFQEAGINVYRYPLCLDRVMPTANMINYTYLAIARDRVSIFGRHGIGVMFLLKQPESDSSWIYGDPSHQWVLSSGAVKRMAGRTFNFFDDWNRKQWFTFVNSTSIYFASDASVLGFFLTNEWQLVSTEKARYLFPFSNNTQHCDENDTSLFQEWLEEYYGDETPSFDTNGDGWSFNMRFDTAFKSWVQVPLPEITCDNVLNRGLVFFYNRWRQEYVASFYNQTASYIKSKSSRYVIAAPETDQYDNNNDNMDDACISLALIAESQFIDVISIHVYPYEQDNRIYTTPNFPKGTFKHVIAASITRCLNKTIWISEIGANAELLSEESQAAFIQRYLTDLSNLDVDGVFMYSWKDGGNKYDHGEHTKYGLHRLDGSPRPAFFVYKEFDTRCLINEITSTVIRVGVVHSDDQGPVAVDSNWLAEMRVPFVTLTESYILRNTIPDYIKAVIISGRTQNTFVWKKLMNFLENGGSLLTTSYSVDTNYTYFFPEEYSSEKNSRNIFYERLGINATRIDHCLSYTLNISWHGNVYAVTNHDWGGWAANFLPSNASYAYGCFKTSYSQAPYIVAKENNLGGNSWVVSVGAPFTNEAITFNMAKSSEKLLHDTICAFLATIAETE